MKAVTKITFYDAQGEKFFGEGPAQLLQAVEETGSLRAAAISMNMAYSKAMKLLKQAEHSLGFPLTVRTVGGKDGGGSALTPEARQWLTRYQTYAAACTRANEELFREMFPRVGCVIMASGLGRRFGGNKLMADFCGQPMFSRALDATEGLFDRRVVVTRHPSVARLCQERKIAVVLHELPHRSDTVRLGLEVMQDMDACLFCPADQPLLRTETVAALLQHWKENRMKICRPSCEGHAGAPVLFPRWAFEELRTLPQGKGGGWVTEKHPDLVDAMPIQDPWELQDADTPQMLEILRQRSADRE